MLEALALCAAVSSHMTGYWYFLPRDVAAQMEPVIPQRAYSAAIFKAADGQTQEALAAIAHADKLAREMTWGELRSAVEDCESQFSGLPD